MKLKFIAATAFMVVVFSPTVKAEELPFQSDKFKKLDLVIETITPKEPEASKPIEHIVIAEDTLEKLAKTYNTTVERIFDKNPEIVNPDLILPDQKLVIPFPEEKLEDRPLPVQEPVVEPVRRSQGANVTAVSNQRVVSNSPGNRYSRGYCTWGVKNWRPDIPNTWGDAINWYRRAQADGWATSSTPQINAIAWTKSYSHVSLVIGIGNGTVTVREMNFVGRNQVSTRTAPISEFLYIL